MSVNHFSNSDINPRLDAYVKTINADTLQFENLTVSDIDVSATTKAQLYRTTGIATTIDLASFRSSNPILSNNIQASYVNAGDLTAQTLACEEVQTSVGVWNPDNKYINNINTILGGKLTNFINCFPDDATAYDAFWKYSKINHEQTFINNQILPVTTVRCNVYARSINTLPSSNYFGFTILDSEITTNTEIISIDGCCQALVATTSPFFAPVRWMTQIDNTTIGNTAINVRFGDVSQTQEYYPANQILYFQLDISYVNIPV